LPFSLIALAHQKALALLFAVDAFRSGSTDPNAKPLSLDSLAVQNVSCFTCFLIFLAMGLKNRA